MYTYSHVHSCVRPSPISNICHFLRNLLPFFISSQGMYPCLQMHCICNYTSITIGDSDTCNGMKLPADHLIHLWGLVPSSLGPDLQDRARCCRGVWAGV